MNKMPRISPFTRTWTVAPRNERDYSDLFDGVEFDVFNPMSRNDMAQLVEDSVFYFERLALVSLADERNWSDEQLSEALAEIESERSDVIECGMQVQNERALKLDEYRDAESWALFESATDSAVLYKSDAKSVNLFKGANPTHTVTELADAGITPPTIFALTPHPLNVIIEGVRYVLPQMANAPRIEQDSSELLRTVAGMPVYRVTNRPTLTGFLPVPTSGITFVVGAMFVGHRALVGRPDILALDSQRDNVRSSYCGQYQSWVTRLMELH